MSNVENIVHRELTLYHQDLTQCALVVLQYPFPFMINLLTNGLASGEYIDVFLSTDSSRPRNPIYSSTPAQVYILYPLLMLLNMLPLQEAHYQRSYARDQRCLITGLQQTDTYTHLKVAHIFPQGHDAEVSHYSIA
jgi:hypothetical protein